MDEYIVSARKYRPMSFDSVVGQHALTQTLKNAVKSGKLAHAYLFCGPRGVGKTTCARIFAKAINCLNPTAEGEACNECESCQAFNEQRSYNIFELDAASNNSVENIKALMEQTRIPPQVGRYKVFIIDEVHMLSTAAFNAFLKTLEEPPAHVIFVLATTEKHKILPTILSRCQIYDFERMTVQNTIAHLKYVAEKEGITYEEEALEVIAEKADGGMRDALSIFDQAASFCQGNITYKQVIEDLNVLDADNYFSIVDLALANKVSDIMVLLNGVINNGFDPAHLISGLATHCRNVLMAKDASTLTLLECSEKQRARYQEQAKKCPTPFLYKALKLMNECDINYRQSHNKRLLTELTLIQVAQLTQPDEETPGAGRRPAKRLKPIFTHVTVEVRPVAQGVAAANVRTPQNDSQPSAPAPTAAGAAPQGRPAQPVLKISSLGSSVSRMRQMRDAKTETKVYQVSEGMNSAFDQTLLGQKWLMMCNRMPESEVAMSQRMKMMTPSITDYPAFEVVVDNDVVLGYMEKIKGRIVATLAQELHNSSLQMTLRLATHEELKKKALTRMEVFNAMVEGNKAVAKLKEVFGLELA